MMTLKVNVIRKPTIKVKILPRFPSSVTATSPILLSQVGGNYAFSFDLNSIMSSIVSAVVVAITGIFAPLASPAFTGTPTAPTAAVGDNSTQIATTAFTTAQVAVINQMFGSFIGGI